ncbi:MAG TPA: radical SAM protein [Candidatus Eisenbacteria bacterium]|nr:radical SAM protein [Candidatus Eisenbacteria bacterium]
MRSEYREEPCRSALNRVKGMDFDWSLNPYMGCAHRCAFCYVRAFERRADRPAGSQYGQSIRVKVNVAAVLKLELARASWKREFVAIGAATDPYQPAEGIYRLTRSCLEALAEARTPFGLITRGTMVVRDIDVLTEAAKRAEISVNFSIPTLDDDIWRKTEPGTPHPRQRLRVIRRLVDAGIKAGVGIAPVLPGLSDDPQKLAEVVKAARDAGAAFAWASVLYLRPGTKEHFLEVLGNEWPELTARYEAMYRSRAYLAKADTEPVQLQVRQLKAKYRIGDRRRRKLEPPPEPVQLDLAV